MSLGTRKAIGLEQKLDSLTEEMRHWQCEAAAEGPLEKHHTQVAAVTGELAVPIDELRGRTKGLDGGTALATGSELEGMILDLHRIWDTFRSKLALRYVTHFADSLVGSDELAYRCYQPAEKHGAAREPPLVYFGGELSPLTRLRGGAIADETSGWEPLRRLPVHLIGLPWFQVEHMPDAPIIAHEVGHDVEADLGLAPEAAAAVDDALSRAGADQDHREAWAAWRQEAFADVFGTLALGPAFASTLADFLASEPRVIKGQWQAGPNWASHPPSTLRVHLCAATLELMDGDAYAGDAARLRDSWSAQYPSHAMTCFECDARVVARALVEGPYEKFGPGPLSVLIDFCPEAHERAARDACEALKGRRPRCTDARELVAAARLAFDASPGTFRDAGVSPRILRAIRAAQTVGTRAGTKTTVSAEVRAARARAEGEWLTDYLKGRHVQAQHD